MLGDSAYEIYCVEFYTMSKLCVGIVVKFFMSKLITSLKTADNEKMIIMPVVLKIREKLAFLMCRILRNRAIFGL